MPRAALLFLAAVVTAALVSGCRLPEPPASVKLPPVTTQKPSPEPPPERNAGLRFDEVSHEGKRYTICAVNLEEWDLELFWRDEHKQPFNTFGALDQWLQTRGRRLLFAMNAGMYQEDYTPCGLYIEKGERLHKLNLADGSSNFCLKPNGVFAVTSKGAVVVESSAFSHMQEDAELATQSGPMLVIKGKLHPAFGPDSDSRLFRNGVGVIDYRTVVFAISEDPVNFHEFAVFFRDRMNCDDALYLDGTISSMYSRELDRWDQLTSLGPIIAVTEELPEGELPLDQGERQ